MSNIISNFNWIDFTIIGIIVFSVFIGFFRGFVREAVSLLIWIGSIIFAFKLSEPLQIYLFPWINSNSLRYTIAFGSLFLSVFIFGIFINLIVRVLVKKTGLTITDHLLGIVFGAGRGFFIVSALLMLISISDIKDGSAVNQSQLAPKFESIMMQLKQFLPYRLNNIFQWEMESLRTKTNEGDK